MRAELFEAITADLGEGAQLFPDGSLWWVDLPKGQVFRKTDGPSHQAGSYPYEVSRVLPWLSGQLLLTRRGIEARTFDRHPSFVLPVTSHLERGRCSDGTVLPDGSVAVGVVDRDLQPGLGSLVTVGIDLGIRIVVDNCTIPNGIASLASGESVVWTDSATQTLTLFDWNEKDGMHSPRPWIQIPEHLGIPDGLVADSDGGVWVALWGGGTVVHVSASGTIDESIEVDTPYPTSVAFDADDNLIMTSGCIIFREQSLFVPRGAGGLWWVPAAEHGTRGLSPISARLQERTGQPSYPLGNPPSRLHSEYSEHRKDH